MVVDTRRAKKLVLGDWGGGFGEGNGGGVRPRFFLWSYVYHDHVHSIVYNDVYI